MALQLSFRKGLSASMMRSTYGKTSLAPMNLMKRWQSSSADAGDVIGIDLGTTNSCVAIMVSKAKRNNCRVEICEKERERETIPFRFTQN
jgi:molecular chaperone DnaK